MTCSYCQFRVGKQGLSTGDTPCLFKSHGSIHQMDKLCLLIPASYFSRGRGRGGSERADRPPPLLHQHLGQRGGQSQPRSLVQRPKPSPLLHVSRHHFLTSYITPARSKFWAFFKVDRQKPAFRHGFRLLYLSQRL